MTKNIKSLIPLFNAWLPPLVWAGVIFLLSGQEALPRFEASGLEFFSKKLAHLLVYAILYLLFWRAMAIRSPLRISTKKQLLVPILLCFVYAISDEFHQSLVSGRYATLRDVGFDMMGVTSAFFWKSGYI